MPATLDKPVLWSITEAASILGLSKNQGPKTVSDLIRAHHLEPKKTSNGKVKGLDRADLDVLARALNRTLPA